MIRLIAFLLGVALVAFGLSWLADRPGTLVVNWQNLEIETSVFRAVVLLGLVMALSVAGWALFRSLWRSPASVGQFFNRRRQERGLDALSGGLIAIGAGDKAQAQRYALAARKALPNEPLTHLLRAQTAQLTGDRGTSRRIFEAMLGSPDTEQLGLRGLFLEAERERETEASRQFARRALELNPRLVWASDALFELQCKAADWEGALETLASARRNGLIEKPLADRRRAVLLTAQAQALEESETERALGLAQEAHRLASDLVPAAAIAGRIQASRGQTAKVARIVESTWKRQPHPELATIYAHSRPGDSPRDRLERVRRLARATPNSIEAPIALANAAIEARDWPTAREALEGLAPEQLTQRVCTLMARIEAEESANKGRAREWLARAVNAPRDPAWTADGFVSETWAAVSPVTGALDAFQWRVPGAPLGKQDADQITRQHQALIALGDVPAPPSEPEPPRQPRADAAPQPAPPRVTTAVVIAGTEPPPAHPGSVTILAPAERGAKPRPGSPPPAEDIEVTTAARR